MEITEKILIKLYEVINKKYENKEDYLRDKNNFTWNYFQKLDFNEWFFEYLKKESSLRKKFTKKMFLKKEDLVNYVYKWTDYYGWQDN